MLIYNSVVQTRRSQRGQHANGEQGREPRHGRHHCRGGGLGLIVSLPGVGVDGGDGVDLCKAQFGAVVAVLLVHLGDLRVTRLGKLDIDTLRRRMLAAGIRGEDKTTARLTYGEERGAVHGKLNDLNRRLVADRDIGVLR